MALLEVTLDDRSVLDALQALARRTGDLSSPLREIGETLTESAKQRFAVSVGPDGARWAPNTELTILRYLDGRAGAFGKKDGRLTKKGASLATGKKPLVAEGNLASTITYQVIDGGRTLLVGSPQKYAAVQQFGAARGSLGKGAPWGDIPARPFLGVSDEDRRNIVEIVRGYLTGA